MCYYNDTEKSYLMDFIYVHFVSKRKIFMGWDVVQKLRTFKSEIDKQAVWLLLRELYMDREFPFDFSSKVPYATATVGGEFGPLLFFPQPNYIVKRSEDIQFAIEGVQTPNRIPGDLK